MLVYFGQICDKNNSITEIPETPTTTYRSTEMARYITEISAITIYRKTTYLLFVVAEAISISAVLGKFSYLQYNACCFQRNYLSWRNNLNYQRIFQLDFYFSNFLEIFLMFRGLFSNKRVFLQQGNTLQEYIPPTERSVSISINLQVYRVFTKGFLSIFSVSPCDFRFREMHPPCIVYWHRLGVGVFCDVRLPIQRRKEHFRKHLT